jgi:hypothetical protein
MRLCKARIQNYRSIRDTGLFDIEDAKTILVGPNEAGKTALLKALQQINSPEDIAGFDPLRDYPRAKYNDIDTGRVDAAKITVVEAHFSLESKDKSLIAEEFHDCTYVYGRRLNNKSWHHLDGGPDLATYGSIKNDLARLCSHIDPRISQTDQEDESIKPSTNLGDITALWEAETTIDTHKSEELKSWLNDIFPLVEEDNSREGERYDKLSEVLSIASKREEAINTLHFNLPLFVLFSNYFRVKPSIHLKHLADRIETNVLDDDQYDYGNQCLLKLLGFSARELSDLGKAPDPQAGDVQALQEYRDQLDKRKLKLNAASVKLTEEIRSVWLPDAKRSEADKLLVQADGQYLKVVVEDDLGVEIELDQRSEGFQWLVSFFVVFFAEAAGEHQNAVLLLDEPGLSLHGLKQREFRTTLSRLAEGNQTVYTTHSPFLVGPDELDLVRVVEMTDREVGTKVHGSLSSGDPAALLPLQEALGYDLAQSLFAQTRNLVLEGLTDYWYVEAVAQLLRASGDANLDEKIALLFANSAGKVVYYATILHANKLKVAALLDSDTAGDQAAKQDTLVHTLGNKKILRTKDSYSGKVTNPEIEDLLRETLVKVAIDDLSWDVTAKAAAQDARPIVDIFTAEVADFSKYKLTKAFLRWARVHEASDLAEDERKQWKALIGSINKALK